MNGRNFFFSVIASSFLTLVTIAIAGYFSLPYMHQWLLAKAEPESEADRALIESSADNAVDSIPDVIERVTPAVVSVVVTKDVPIYEQYYEEYDPFGGFFGGGFSIPRLRENGSEEREVGGGSGFIVSEDGLIVTNRHVVSDDQARYSILMNDGTSHEVTVLAKDPVLDIAVLKISDATETSFPALTFGDSTVLRQGDTVIAIGNALAEFRNSVSVGIISGLARSVVAGDGRGMSEQLDQVIQTDAAINPGNSGGPLLNEKGEVIGVNVAASLGAENIGFALPSSVVTSVVDSVKTYGEIRRPYLGIRYTMITDRLRENNTLPVEYGALISRGANDGELAVMPGSPADKAGLVENDIILAIDDTELRDTDLATVLRTKSIGDTVSLRVYHRGETITISVTLEAMPQ